MPADLTRSVEDYLKAIYQFAEAGQAATTTGIAEHLGVAAPSVSGMLRRLSDQGLVLHEPYKGVTLTRTGKREALRMLRRHRLIEAYLVERLGYTWDTVHDEAERLEHAVSDDLVSRMAEALGDPRFDPHGDPIPGTDGVMEVRPTVPLPDVPMGATVTIARVDTEAGDRLRWFAENGLIPGAVITVVEHQPFSGPVTVQRGRARQVVGRDLASQLLCIPGGR
jgi:DtxR family Mn-dependent transcriptional regulator